MRRFAFLIAFLACVAPALAQQRSGPLIAHFNLSDLPSPATARVNLGLGAMALLGITGTPANGDCAQWVVTGGVPTSLTTAGAGCSTGGGGGGVSSVAFSPGSSGLTVTGSPITSSGTITISGGLLAQAFGGTGASSLANADIPVWTGTMTPNQCAYWVTTTALGSTPCSSAGSYLPLAGGTMTGMIQGLSLSLSNAQGTDGGGLTLDENGGINTIAGQFGVRMPYGIRPFLGSYEYSAQDAQMIYPQIGGGGPYTNTIDLNQFHGLRAGEEIIFMQENAGGMKFTGSGGTCHSATGGLQATAQWAVVHVYSDGTNCYVTGDISGSGGIVGVQTFCASGCTHTSGSTYTPDAGTYSVIVEVVGSGAGGGGAPATSSGQSSAAGGGGGGSYGKGQITTGFSGVTVTAPGGGAGGAAGSNDGTAGSASSFGTLISCPGGAASGNHGLTETGVAISGGGAAGGGNCTFSGATQIVNNPGGAGLPGMVFAGGSVALSGAGGPSFLGQPGAPVASATGNTATGYGAGGAGGGQASPSASAQAGGAGSPGIVIVTEYR